MSLVKVYILVIGRVYSFIIVAYTVFVFIKYPAFRVHGEIRDILYPNVKIAIVGTLIEKGIHKYIKPQNR